MGKLLYVKKKKNAQYDYVHKRWLLWHCSQQLYEVIQRS